MFSFQTNISIVFVTLLALTHSFLNEVDVNAEVNDYYFMEDNDMEKWFGKKHLQKNKEKTFVQ